MATAQLFRTQKQLFAGDTFQVGLGFSDPVTAASFTLRFDPAVFEHQKGSVVTSLATRTEDDATPGTVTFSGSGGPGSVQVAFSFKAISSSAGSEFSASGIVLDGQPVNQTNLIIQIFPLEIHSAEAQRMHDGR